MQISKEEAIKLCKEFLINSADYASLCFNSGVLKCVEALENMSEENAKTDRSDA